jgi:hypothetical protein
MTAKYKKTLKNSKKNKQQKLYYGFGGNKKAYSSELGGRRFSKNIMQIRTQSSFLYLKQQNKEHLYPNPSVKNNL